MQILCWNFHCLLYCQHFVTFQGEFFFFFLVGKRCGTMLGDKNYSELPKSDGWRGYVLISVPIWCSLQFCLPLPQVVFSLTFPSQMPEDLKNIYVFIKCLSIWNKIVFVSKVKIQFQTIEETKENLLGNLYFITKMCYWMETSINIEGDF